MEVLHLLVPCNLCALAAARWLHNEFAESVLCVVQRFAPHF